VATNVKFGEELIMRSI